MSNCLLDCFAHHMCVGTDYLIKCLGHDGTEILYPDLPEPFCRRGFNVFELLDLAVHRFHYGILLLRHIEALNKFTLNDPKMLNLDLTSKWFKSDRNLIVMTDDHAVIVKNRHLVYDPRITGKLTFEQAEQQHQAIILF